MTTQLKLMDTQNTKGRPAPSQPYRRLDERTRELGRIGVREALAALDEADRRVAEREAQRIARRDNELADRARTARRAALTLTPGSGLVTDDVESALADTAESTSHQSAA
ncbi:MAG: hypothetical protein WBA45_10200 [Microthrixaceae bacterium]